MDSNVYQDLAGRTAVYDKNKELEYLTLGLASEAGEVAGKVKKFIRGDGDLDRMALAYELGDVLWYVATMSNSIGFSLGRIAEMNLSKLQDRKIRDALRGVGDER